MKFFRLIIGSLFVLSFSTATAQLAHPHFLSLNFGTNIPVGDYGTIDSLSSAGANPGVYYSFEGAAYFSKLFGMGVNIGAFNNSVDDDGIVDQLKRDAQYKDGTFDVSSQNWTNGYIMLGPYFSFGSKKFIVDLKVMGGIINSERPFVNISSNNDDYAFNSAAVYSTSFGVNYGMHFRIQLKKKLALRINGEGMLSTQEFVEKISEVSQSGITQPKVERTVERDISALNLGIGLIINL